MTRNQKILVGVGLLGLGYLLWKSSKKPVMTTSLPEPSNKCQKRFGVFGVECNDGSCDVGNGVALPCMGRGGVKGYRTTILPTPTRSVDKEVAEKTDEWLLNYYKNMICTPVTGVYQPPRKLSSETIAFHNAVKKELTNRNLQGKCIDYGMFPPN